MDPNIVGLQEGAHKESRKSRGAEADSTSHDVATGERRQSAPKIPSASTVGVNITRVEVTAAGCQQNKATSEMFGNLDQVMTENEQLLDNTTPQTINKTQMETELTTKSDNSSQMLWSPVKLAGNKRTLDEIDEADDTFGESEEETEEGGISDDEERATGHAGGNLVQNRETEADGLRKVSTDGVPLLDTRGLNPANSQTCFRQN